MDEIDPHRFEDVVLGGGVEAMFREEGAGTLDEPHPLFVERRLGHLVETREPALLVAVEAMELLGDAVGFFEVRGIYEILQRDQLAVFHYRSAFRRAPGGHCIICHTAILPQNRKTVSR